MHSIFSSRVRIANSRFSGLRYRFIPSLRFGTDYASPYNPCHCLKLKNSKLNLHVFCIIQVSTSTFYLHLLQQNRKKNCYSGFFRFYLQRMRISFVFTIVLVFAVVSIIEKSGSNIKLPAFLIILSIIATFLCNLFISISKY